MDKNLPYPHLPPPSPTPPPSKNRKLADVTRIIVHYVLDSLVEHHSVSDCSRCSRLFQNISKSCLCLFFLGGREGGVSTRYRVSCIVFFLLHGRMPFGFADLLAVTFQRCLARLDGCTLARLVTMFPEIAILLDYFPRGTLVNRVFVDFQFLTLSDVSNMLSTNSTSDSPIRLP